VSDRKRVVNNTIYQLVGKFVTMGVAFISTGLITRHFGVENYGAFSLMLSFPALFFTISNFGLNTIATRDLASGSKEIDRYIGSVWVFRLLFSLALMVLAFASLFFLPYSNFLRLGITVGLLTILTTTLISTFSIAYQVRLRYDLFALSNSLGSLLYLGLVFAALYLNFGILFLVWGQVIGGILTCLLSYRHLRGLGIKPVFAFDKSLLAPLFISSLPLGLTYVFSQVNFKSDSILLSVLKLPASFGLSNVETVGIYGLPYKVFEASLIIPTFYMNAFFPIMVKNNSESREKLMLNFKKSFGLLLLLGLAASVFGYFMSPIFVNLLGGSDFSKSIVISRILLGANILFYITQPLFYLIVTLNGQKALPYIYLSAGIINLILNITFIPRYSYLASANITWISELFVILMLVFTARKLLKRA